VIEVKTNRSAQCISGGMRRIGGEPGSGRRERAWRIRRQRKALRSRCARRWGWGACGPERRVGRRPREGRGRPEVPCRRRLNPRDRNARGPLGRVQRLAALSAKQTPHRQLAAAHHAKRIWSSQGYEKLTPAVKTAVAG
jgi:hypothetical protein